MRRNVSIVYVSHDLGVVRNLVDTVAVMYGGGVVEFGAGGRPCSLTRGTRTRGACWRRSRAPGTTRVGLRGIPGSAVEPWDRPEGCAFAPRCELRVHHCDELPELAPLPGGAGRLVRCWRASERFGVPVDPDATVFRRERFL